MSDIQPRKPAGTPAGGEFAGKTGSAPTSTLMPARQVAAVVRPASCDHCEEPVIWDAENEAWISSDVGDPTECSATGGHYSDDDLYEASPTSTLTPAHNPCADMPNLVRVTTPEGSQAWMEETVRSDDAAEVFGDAQVGGTYSYRMVFDNGDGTFRVLDRSWGAVTVDSQGFVSSTEVDDVRTTCHDSTTVCTDPSDPGGTEISSDVEDDGDTWSRESMRFWFKDASLDALKVEALKTAKQRCEQDLAASKGLLESHGVSGW